MGEGGRIMDFFKILNGGIGVSMSNFDRLWVKKFSGWPETKLTGLLPLTFLAEGSALTDYRIYGTEDGAGVQTENLFDGKGEAQNMSAPSLKKFIESNIQVSPGETYCMNASSTLYSRLGFYMNDTRVSGSNWVTTQLFITVPNDCNNAYVEVRNYVYDAITDEQLATATEIMLTKGSTAPTSYIPYGYQIPLTVESGEQSSDYNLYIGDSKLGAEEYLDFGEQKVYKRTENVADINGTWRYFDQTCVATVNGKNVTVDGTWFAYIIVDVDKNATYFLNFEVISYTVNRGVAVFGILNGNINYSDQIRAQSTSNEPISTGDREQIALLFYGGGNEPGTSVYTNIMLVKGSTPPETYIPYLQPTDPPAPFPPISTYKGENTLSSTETVGEVSVKGKIKEAP